VASITRRSARGRSSQSAGEQTTEWSPASNLKERSCKTGNEAEAQCGKREWREGRETPRGCRRLSRSVRQVQNAGTHTQRNASDVYKSSPAASAASSLSLSSGISEVQRVRLSRSSCIIRVESLWLIRKCVKFCTSVIECWFGKMVHAIRRTKRSRGQVQDG
jgi:hypothetical protein